MTFENGLEMKCYRSIKYLVDHYNHTGYSQVLKETVSSPSTETTFIIGSDVLSQATSVDTDQYLLYDGYGSTRQVIDNTGAPTGIQDSFSYDAYGIMLGGSPALPL